MSLTKFSRDNAYVSVYLVADKTCSVDKNVTKQLEVVSLFNMFDAKLFQSEITMISTYVSLFFYHQLFGNIFHVAHNIYHGDHTFLVGTR